MGSADRTAKGPSSLSTSEGQLGNRGAWGDCQVGVLERFGALGLLRSGS